MDDAFTTIVTVVSVLAFVAVAYWALREPGGSRSKPFPVDPTLGDLRAFAIRDAFQRGDAAALEQELSSLDGDPDRGFLLGMAGGGSDGDLPWLDDWVVQAGETSGLPWLVRGIHRIELGWKARGAGVASTVGADARQTFLEWMQQAEADLLRAGELRPQDAEPVALCIVTGLALSAEKSELRELFRQATQRDPRNHTAWHRLMSALTRKWGGSHDEMFDVARRAFELSAENGILATLLLLAHCERWMYFTMAGEPQEEADGYYRRDDVLADLDRAEEVLSGRSGARLTPLQKRQGANCLAFSFWKSGQSERLAAALRVMGDAVTESPWRFTTAGTDLVGRLRRDCGIEG